MKREGGNEKGDKKTGEKMGLNPWLLLSFEELYLLVEELYFLFT